MCATNLSYFYIIFKQLSRADYTRIKQAEQQHRRTQKTHRSRRRRQQSGALVRCKVKHSRCKTKTTRSQRTKCKHNFWTCSDIICAQNYNKSTQTGAGATLLLFLKTHTRTHSERRREERTVNNNWQSAMNKNENKQTIFNIFRHILFFQCFFFVFLFVLLLLAY